MNNVLAVGVTNRVGNLSQDREAKIHRQLLPGQLHELVEALGIGFGSEKNYGAELTIRRGIGSKDAWMIQHLQHLKLTASRVLQDGAFFFTRLTGDLINAGQAPG